MKTETCSEIFHEFYGMSRAFLEQHELDALYMNLASFSNICIYFKLIYVLNTFLKIFFEIFVDDALSLKKIAKNQRCSIPDVD